jgi:hypothetical protein
MPIKFEIVKRFSRKGTTHIEQGRISDYVGSAVNINIKMLFGINE